MWLLVPVGILGVAGMVAGAHTGRPSCVWRSSMWGRATRYSSRRRAGRQVVMDGGAHPLLMTRLLSERMRFYDRRIDIVAATHPHDDHIGGLLQVLERYDVGAVLQRRIEHTKARRIRHGRAPWTLRRADGAKVIQAIARGKSSRWTTAYGWKFCGLPIHCLAARIPTSTTHRSF